MLSFTLRHSFASLVFALLWLGQSAMAQTTAFTYQGKLLDNGNPANGNYDLQVKLFDTAAVGTGTQQGTTQTLINVTVSGGIFTVQLDFGACPTCFDGAARFLEIAVKPTSSGTFTTLGPRQPVTSAPYAIRSTNASSADGLSVACVSCVTSSQIQSINGSAVTGTIPVASVPAGSADYIQNTLNQQANSNFNISGNGTIGGTLTGSLVNALTQYNVNGLRAFTVNGPYNNSGTIFTATNTFAGDGAGLNTTPDPLITGFNGKFNSFFGAGSGQANTTGSYNTYFGYRAGQANIGNCCNAFFGYQAGLSDTASNNAFFGYQAGNVNTAGFNNAFFGFMAGQSNTSGGSNSFFGTHAGFGNSTGNNNTFIGSSTNFFGGVNPPGDNNTLLGANASIKSGVSNSTAIGAFASVAQSNSLILGSNANVGVGTSAPAAKLHVSGTGTIRARVDSDANAGLALTLSNQPKWSVATVSGGQFQIFNDAFSQNAVWIDSASNNVGIGDTTPDDKLDVEGDIRVGTGTTGCVKDADGTMIAGTCSSDARFKRDITPFPKLLDQLVRLHPVNFYWRHEEFKDRHFGLRQSYGLIAQEVEQVMPELVTEDEQGYKAVNYAKLPLLTLQAVKELKQENESLKRRLEQQEQQLAALRRVVCKANPDEEMCKP